MSSLGILSDKPIDRLPDEVGMAHVACVLLDHVNEEPSQAGGPAVGPGAGGEPVQAAGGDRLGYQGAGAAYRFLPQRLELRGAVPGSSVPLPVRVGVPVDGGPGW